MNRSLPYPCSNAAQHPQHTMPAGQTIDESGYPSARTSGSIASAPGYPSADGSIVNDDEYVYVLPMREIMQVDYFHGILRDLGPVAQMMDESEPDILASEMFSTHRDGRTVRAIITLQRRWRKKRLQCRIHTVRMMLLCTARTRAEHRWIRSRILE